MLTRNDFKTHLYPELIGAIERADTTKLETAIKASQLLAKGFMSRFDKAALFSAEQDERDELLLMILKDLTVWNFIIIANPNIDTEFHKERYDDAIKLLEKIQSGKLVPDGWPAATSPEEAGSFFHFASNPRRGTSY
jgi:hypothetical protein